MSQDKEIYYDLQYYVCIIISLASLFAVRYYSFKQPEQPDGVWESMMVLGFFLLATGTLITSIVQNIMNMTKSKINIHHKIVLALNIVTSSTYVYFIYYGTKNNYI